MAFTIGRSSKSNALPRLSGRSRGLQRTADLALAAVRDVLMDDATFGRFIERRDDALITGLRLFEIPGGNRGAEFFLLIFQAGKHAGVARGADHGLA